MENTFESSSPAPALLAAVSQAPKRPPQPVVAELLAAKFDAMRARNPRFSLRSYARKLGISPGATTEILRGKRRISAKLAARFAERLQLEEQERVQLFDGIRGQSG